jgi:hypothetical protein
MVVCVKAPDYVYPPLSRCTFCATSLASGIERSIWIACHLPVKLVARCRHVDSEHEILLGRDVKCGQPVPEVAEKRIVE